MKIPPDDPRPLVSVVDQYADFMEEAPAVEHGEDDRSDKDWLKSVYQGDQMPEFTLRAIVMGMIIGGVMSISNLYIGLKSGWGLGVTITACVIAFAVFKTLETVIPAYRRRPFTIMEDCTMTACASAGGAITTAGLISAIPALYLCTGQPLSWWQMTTWIVSVALLGLFMAVPLKRQLINIDKLSFPTGTATAETLRSLHTTGGNAMQQAKCLFGCALFGAVLKIWVDAWRPIWAWIGEKAGNPDLGAGVGRFSFPETIPFLPGKFGKSLLENYTLGFEGSVLFLAAGAIMGIRIGFSLLMGAILFFGILGPLLIHYEILKFTPAESHFTTISTHWTLWPAVALMVSAGLTSFALRWKTIARSFGELRFIFGMKKKQEDPLTKLEAPMWWFLVGTVLAGLMCVLLGVQYFTIRPEMGILAVALSFVLAVVAARATGETDITPIGAMGKITQLTYGTLAPKNLSVNLMTASITSGAACHCADLLQAQKAGYLVGATPRRLAIAQFFGVLAGVVVCVPVYMVIVHTPTFSPDAPAATTATSSGAPTTETPGSEKTNLLTREFPAPAAAMWKAVAVLLKEGWKKLPEGTGVAMLIAVVLGIGIALLEEFLPRQYIKWVPSATGLGIAGVISGTNSVMMFLGALAAWIWMKKRPISGEKYIIAGSSGLIAGESLMGVTINLWKGAPTIAKAVWPVLRDFWRSIF
ncbi:MAG: OPT/YSL family transporter [Pirellulales bacterium]|nr:OPT/YSL family transporter [Pirellulales bacterium]